VDGALAYAEPMPRPAPPSPGIQLANRTFAFGGAALLVALVGAVSGAASVGLLCGACGALLLWAGFVTKSSSIGADALNRAWDATSRGRLAEAQGMLDRAAATFQLAYIRQAIDPQIAE